MGKKSPEMPDFQALNEEQTQANRPNLSTPFASQQWQQGPDGQWAQSTGFAGPLGGVADSLQQQAAGAYGTPFRLDSLGAMPTGDAARDQAIQGAYGQATSRLDPQWQQREQGQRTQLLNQGLTEGTEAYQAAMGNLGRERNDAYSSAMNNAIGQGTQAGSAMFQQGMQGRQQALAELLRQRGQPMAELQQLSGLLPGAGLSGAGASNALSAGLGGYNAALGGWQAQNQANADVYGGAANLLMNGGAMFALCDERAKEDVVRLEAEAMPGVPMATWRYRGGTQRYLGVIAQDLERVSPQHVHTDSTGAKWVRAPYLPRAL